MKSTPKVSVILTSYNHAEFIKDSINSIINQSFQDFELIIWDDCSTDNSWEVILSFDDPRIRSFRNENNQSGNTIGKAIEEIAVGKYIAIHHSDDIWDSTKLEKQVNFLEKNQDYLAVFSHVKFIDESGEIYPDEDLHYSQIFDQPNRSRFDWLRYFFFNGNALCMPSVLFYKSIYKELKQCHGLYQLTDFSLWVQFCLLGEIFILQERLVCFRIHKDASNWSGDRPETRIRMRFEWLKILDHYKEIKSVDELIRIFPEADRYVNENNADILFALGMIVLELGDNVKHRLFGLNLLYDALNDPLRSENLRIYQGFDEKKFFLLTARHDVFSVQYIKNLNNNFQKMEQELAKSKQEVLFYSLSKSWRITKPLRDAMNIIREFIHGNQI